MEIFALLIVIVLLILSISRWGVHPFLALLVFGLIYGTACGIDPTESVSLLLEGFAKTLQWVAVIMIFGAMIGEIANETGGAERIAHATLRVAGPKRLPAAMGVTGYIISIPVFVDVAYIMMQSVTEALAARSKQKILAVGLSLVAGLTATHALMPPTPGPLAVAGILEAQLGRMILINFFVAMAAMTGGVLWAALYCKKVELDYDRELREQHAQADQDDLTTPTAGATLLALLPIFVPLILIAIRSFLGEEHSGSPLGVFRFLGTPFVALLIGVLLALAQYGKGFSMKRLGAVTERSIEKAALVIMITGAGGAFGHVIRSSGITDQIGAYASDAGGLGFLFPFILASVFTTTTGSITVSMITTASIVTPLMPALGISPEMTAALIGSGSFCVFHVNSSFFWLLNRLHKVPAETLLRTYTIQSLFMGVFGVVAVFILWLFGLR
ncbi:MAG: GntP family permease, partial [Planctomycetota bacterium]